MPKKKTPIAKLEDVAAFVKGGKKELNLSNWKLKRTKQCAKCPWRQDANPWEIPGDYSLEQHQDLAVKIAEPGALEGINKPLPVMACHEHDSPEGVLCVGWLQHQLNEGNNSPLRIQFMTCQNADSLEVIGPQHPTFQDTLPKTPALSDTLKE